MKVRTEKGGLKFEIGSGASNTLFKNKTLALFGSGQPVSDTS